MFEANRIAYLFQKPMFWAEEGKGFLVCILDFLNKNI